MRSELNNSMLQLYHRDRSAGILETGFTHRDPGDRIRSASHRDKIRSAWDASHRDKIRSAWDASHRDKIRSAWDASHRDLGFRSTCDRLLIGVLLPSRPDNLAISSRILNLYDYAYYELLCRGYKEKMTNRSLKGRDN